MNRRGALTIAVLASAAIMSGCYESTGVTVHGCTTTAGRPTRLPTWLKELGPGN